MSELRYLLDTNIISDLVRNPNGAVYRRIAAVGHETICTSAIVLCELQYGIAKRGSRSLGVQLQMILGSLHALSFDSKADRHYARIRVNLERSGRPISPNDLFIAAHASSLGLTLVTNNTREFGRIEGLTIEDWLGEPMPPTPPAEA